MNYITELVSESGKVSTTRVGVFLVLVCSLFCVIYATITGKTLPELSPEWVLLVATGFGAKVWQKRYENPQPKPTDS